MQGILDRLVNSDKILYALFTVTCIGMFYSRAIVSISTTVFLAIGLVALLRKGAIRRLRSDPWAIALMSVMLVYLASGICSADTASWWRRVFTNMPYLAIPLALHAFGPFSKKQYTRLLVIFIGATLLSALIILFDYAQNFSAYNEIYKVGKTIPTPIIHVRYSYFLAMACMLCLGLLMQGGISVKRERWFLIATGVFLLIFLHILAVRTGLLAFYGGVLTLVIVMIIRERKWRIAGIAIFSLSALSMVAYLSMPSLANKIGYMRHDLRMLREQGALPQYSDNARLTSITYGLTLFARNPIIGVGIGDLPHEMNAMYEERSPDFPASRRYLPISQYVYWLSALGLVGTALLMGLWLYPLKDLWKKSYLIVAIYGATLFSFLAETTIQLQLGKTMFLLMLCIVLQYYRHSVVAESAFTAGRPAGNDLIE